ncbi:PaaI family thioesterase [Alcaligenes nematophilus]|jgi:acyl-coenzyme A thioesterase PaaI-like protein|uniref:PaaI family thioesterase n=1 Tax=Alcaligenes TaxID=507 RepID=UPI0020303861|nr:MULTISPECIES: PaaI family thioesterase [Alcaligenes]URW82909.1 PaaI family thioesterase [Alcaligenes sp. DN25]UUO11248.1 PaaI family thioesterase [Alcaligenes faecalis]WEA67738.1 PaaI family thioesterase [Alcaligenes faecalis]
MVKAFQDFYADNFSHCYGCGKHNPDGHQLKSYWDGDDTVARYTPKPIYSGGVPNHVYGGLIASLLDCHGTASAAAFIYRDLNIEMGTSEEPIRCVTASLKVEFRRPTPMGTELTVQGKLRELDGRKVWVDLLLSANGEVCATGEMLAIRFKE